MTTPDIDALFRTRGTQLRRIVSGDVRTTGVGVEDACQSAWERLLGERGRVRTELAFSWLTTTATREARAAVVDAGRRESLEALIGDAGEAADIPPDVSFGIAADARARLGELERLPVRQRRLLWLQGLGLSYEEMAAHEACTRRTVERQLMRAKRQLARA